MNIPLKFPQPVWQNVAYGIVYGHCILAKGLYRFKAKRPFRPSGGSVFLPPDFSGQVMGTVRLTVPCEVVSCYHGYN